MTYRRSLGWSMVAVAAWLGSIGSAWAQFNFFKKTTETKEPTQKIAHFEISGAVAETPVNIPPLFGADPPVSLKALLARFEAAREDPSVVAVVVDLQNAVLGIAQLEEIHEAIAKFAAVDKDVYVHADGLTTRTYAAATAATHISLVPTGNLWLMGIYGEQPYLRGMLDKLAVVPDFVRCGEYKSAVELVTRTGPSDEAKEMYGWLMDGLYASLVKVIADGRGVSEAKV
ncbi:MAG: S49 family peptidase, partial [Planctomycetes bacterium]|nr:S49 family peptidase [Planctomycetota bacterium]